MDAMRYRLRLFLAITACVMILGTFGFSRVEGLSLLDALYFSVVTVTTVGYGDLHPVSPAGKVLAMVLIVSGVGTFAGLVANVTEVFLTRRERALRQEKIRTITSIFFSRMGAQLLAVFARADTDSAGLVGAADQPVELYKLLKEHQFRLEAARVDRPALTAFLVEHTDFLLRLWENPALAEETEFTALLRAVFHLSEELYHRQRYATLPPADLAHLNGDLNRVYVLLGRQWLTYLDDIQVHFPYLHHLALRMNPFDPERSVLVES